MAAAPGQPRDSHYIDFGTEEEPDLQRSLLIEPSSSNYLHSSEEGLEALTGAAYADKTEGRGFRGYRSQKYTAGTSTIYAKSELSIPAGPLSVSLWAKVSPDLVGRDLSLAGHTAITIDSADWIYYEFNSTTAGGSIGIQLNIANPIAGTSWLETAMVQVEASSKATSYIPNYNTTSSQSALRAEDRLEFPLDIDIPNTLTVYLEYIDIGDIADTSVQAELLNIGDTIIYSARGSANQMHSSINDTDQNLSFGTGKGDLVKVAIKIDTDWATSYEYSLNNEASNNQAGLAIGKPDDWLDDLSILFTSIDAPYGLRSIKLFSSVEDLEHCEANTGDIFNYSIGDRISADIFSRASAGLHEPVTMVKIPKLPNGWAIACFDEAFIGNRVPIRDSKDRIVGTVTQGVDESVGTSNPTLVKGGWSIDNNERLEIDFVDDLDIPRSKSELITVIDTTDPTFVLWHDDSLSLYGGAFINGSSSDLLNQFGGSVVIDDTEITTREQASEAVRGEGPVFIKFQGNDLSLENGLVFGAPNTANNFTGIINTIVFKLTDDEVLDTERDQVYQHLLYRLTMKQGVYLEPPTPIETIELDPILYLD